MEHSALHAAIEFAVVVWAVTASIGWLLSRLRAAYFESQCHSSQNARRQAERDTQHWQHELETLEAKIKRRARREDPDA